MYKTSIYLICDPAGRKNMKDFGNFKMVLVFICLSRLGGWPYKELCYPLKDKVSNAEFFSNSQIYNGKTVTIMIPFVK